MKKLAVHYQGWGEDWLLGTLADDGRDLLFEYSQRALDEQLELSPVRFKLRTATYSGFPAHLWGLPGLMADALPDGWGRLLMDRLARKQGLNPALLSPLEPLFVARIKTIADMEKAQATPRQRAPRKLRP